MWETLCVSACASAATFPVLVLRGLSASLYALVSSVAVLWLVEPILQLGLVTALFGCWPALAPAAPGVLPVRGHAGRVLEPLGPLGIRLARGTDLF